MTAPHLGPGHIIAGKYRIVGLIGFTGEVATYRVTGPQSNELVVKLYDPAVGQRADVMARLDRVHSALVRLPNEAVRVLDTGYDLGTGAPFTATEHVTFPSVAQLAASGPMPIHAVVAMVQGIARVMDAAHALALHHLALKPSNVFIGAGAVRVTDFEASVVRNTSPTHEAYARSAPWWAPEQLNPSAVVGSATDVFATGLLLFFALTGRSYWLSCQTSRPDLQRWQAEIMAPRPLASERARELGVALNPALDVVFERALAVAQADRPRSIGELATALAALAGYRSDNVAKTLAFPDEPLMSENIPGQDQVPPPGHALRDHRGGGYPQSPSARPMTADLDSAAGSRERQPTAREAQSPGLPPIPLKPQRKANPIWPIVLGVGVALLVGAAGLAFLFMRSEKTAVVETDGQAGSDKLAAPPDDKDEEPEETTSAAGGGSGAGGGAPSMAPSAVAVTIRCVPTCDEIWVNGKKRENVAEALTLEPGLHQLRMLAKGHYPRTDSVRVEADKPLEKEYRLVPIGSPRPSTSKPCGQFLTPCP